MSAVPDWVPDAYKSDVAVSAAKYGVRPELLAAVLQIESNFSPTAKSSAGAEGIAQFEPGTAASYGVNPWDPTSSIDGAAHLLSDLEKQFGNETLALAAYNGGPGAIQNGTPTPQTASYAQTVLKQSGATDAGNTTANASGSTKSGNNSDNPFSYLSASDWDGIQKKWKGSDAGFNSLRADLTNGKLFSNTGNKKVDTAANLKHYGWTGTDKEWATFAQNMVNTATKVSAKKSDPIQQAADKIGAIYDLISKIVSFFTNASLRNRILIGAVGVLAALIGVYFAVNGLTDGQAGTQLKQAAGNAAVVAAL